ncbi:MAG: VanZ family protein, partial [Longimicrobiales bacterium]
MSSVITASTIRADERGAAAAPTSGRRLTLALLGYYLAVVAVITLVPFRFTAPERFAFVRLANWPDFLANVLLFLPFGFLCRAARPGTRSGEAWPVLALGALASFAVECLQLF